VTEGISVAIRRYPYRVLAEDGDFASGLRSMVASRADDIVHRHEAGEYRRPSMGFVILDPTLGPAAWRGEEILMIAAVGEEGSKYACNAYAKAALHRAHGVNCGIPVYTQPQRLGDGSFLYGHSVDLEGTVVAASGQSEAQDRYQAAVLAAEFNYFVARRYERWRSDNRTAGWLSAQGEVPTAIADVVRQALESTEN
jgi:hypothetical protein